MSLRFETKKRALNRMRERAHGFVDNHLELAQKAYELHQLDQRIRLNGLLIEGDFFKAMTAAVQEEPSLAQRILRFWRRPVLAAAQEKKT